MKTEEFESGIPSEAQKNIDHAISLASNDIRKFNEQFSAFARALDALSFDDKRDPKGVADEGNKEASEEIRLLQLQHAGLAKQGLTISALENGKDVTIVGGGKAPAKATGMIAYLDIADADRFAEYLAGMQIKKDRLGLRQFALVELLATFEEQIEKNLIKPKWSFGDDKLENLEIRDFFNELVRKLSYAIKEANLAKSDALSESSLGEYISRADDGTLPEFVLYEQTIGRREKLLTSLNKVDMERRDFTDLESAWGRAVCVFERLAANPQTKALADECYEVLGKYHLAAGEFMKENFKTEWESGMTDKLPEEGTIGHTEFSAYAHMWVQKLDTLGRRIEEIRSGM